MTVFIDKFWIEGVLTEAYPSFIKEGGVDLDGNGAIEGKEVFGDLDKDGTVGDRDDYKEYLRQNRSQLSAKIPFFKWGEKLSVDNRIHQAIYLESDIHSAAQIVSAYLFIAGLVEKMEKEIGPEPLPPQREAQSYYTAMEHVGISFKAQDDSSLVGNINARQLDCDTSSFVAMAVGDEKGVRLQPVRAPNHVFLRGNSGEENEFNIDFGTMTFNEKYDVDSDLVGRGVYLKTLDNRQLEGLFLENRGLVLYNLGRHEEALASYDRAIVLDPKYTGTYYSRGVVLEKLGRNEEALASYDKAIALDPKYAFAHYNRGVVLEKLGRNEEALASYDKAIALNPKDAIAHYNRGLVLEKLGRYQDALKAFERAGQLDATFSPSSIERLRLRFLGYWEL